MEDGGWWAFNVWESDETAQAFFRDFVNPALSEASVTLQDMQRLRVTWDSDHPRDDA